MADEHKIIDLSRQAAIVGVANLLEGYAKAKQLRKGKTHSDSDFRRRGRRDAEPVPADAAKGAAAPGPSPSDPNNGDFLFDFLRLNAEYLNRLAQLGKDNRHIATRALENLHSRAFERGLRRAATLIFEPTVNARRFELENKLDPKATVVHLACSPLRGPITLPSADVTFSLGTTIVGPVGSYPIVFDGPPVSITMSIAKVKFPPIPDAEYAGAITVLLGQHEKELSFLIKREGPSDAGK